MRRILLSAIKILISAALLYFSLRKVDLHDLAARFNLESLLWTGLAIAVMFVQIFIGVLRWREISAECGVPLEIRQAMRFNLIGTFFNQTLPSSIGGDAVRLWLVNRTGAGWRAATYSILTDRAIGLIALALIIVASLPWSYGMIANSKGRLALVFVDFAALSGGLGFLLLGHLRKPATAGNVFPIRLQKRVRQRRQKADQATTLMNHRQTDQPPLAPTVNRLGGDVQLAAEFF